MITEIIWLLALPVLMFITWILVWRVVKKIDSRSK